MRDLLAHLRAAISPQVMLALACALLLLFFAALSSGEEGASALEKRTERVLSAVSGAGKVNVVINMRAALQTGRGISAAQPDEIPAGAVAVAQGADDPVVHYELQQALCALLSLPASAVSVVTGGE